MLVLQVSTQLSFIIIVMINVNRLRATGSNHTLTQAAAQVRTTYGLNRNVWHDHRCTFFHRTFQVRDKISVSYEIPRLCEAQKQVQASLSPHSHTRPKLRRRREAQEVLGLTHDVSLHRWSNLDPYCQRFLPRRPQERQRHRPLMP